MATLQEDGSVTLRVRLPDALGGEHIVLAGIRFRYGHEHLCHALAQQQARAESKARVRAAIRAATPGQSPKFSQKLIDGGVAITWRFMRQLDGSWRVSFTTTIAEVQPTTSRLLGALGVDFNAGFVSVAEADRFGNLLYARNLKVPTMGRSADQRSAAMAEAVKRIVEQCRRTAKPLVIEDLDFSRKKKSEALGTRQRRTVSALAYAEFRRLCEARAHDAGVELVLVDPAYTSTQGLVRYACRRGWSVHQAAAGVIARRGLGFLEKAPVRGTLRVPLADAVEWRIPEDICRSDVRRRWPKLHQGLRGAVALHFRRRHVAGERGLARPGHGESEVAGGIPAPKRTLRAPALA